MPPELLAQIPVVEEALVAMGVTTWAMVEHEADDALGAAAAIADADERVEQVLIVTPDKDLGQCVRGTRVVQFDRRKREIIDEAGVIAKFGVPPASIPDYLGLVGDSADGFPGIAGWGAKSAAAVLARYGHLEDIPDSAGQWDVPGPARRGEAVAARCAPTSSWRCCSAASPPSSSTSRSAPSTTGRGPARPRTSTEWADPPRRATTRRARRVARPLARPRLTPSEVRLVGRHVGAAIVWAPLGSRSAPARSPPIVYDTIDSDPMA